MYQSLIDLFYFFDNQYLFRLGIKIWFNSENNREETANERPLNSVTIQSLCFCDRPSLLTSLDTCILSKIPSTQRRRICKCNRITFVFVENRHGSAGCYREVIRFEKLRFHVLCKAKLLRFPDGLACTPLGLTIKNKLSFQILAKGGGRALLVC